LKKTFTHVFFYWNNFSEAQNIRIGEINDWETLLTKFTYKVANKVEKRENIVFFKGLLISFKDLVFFSW